MGKHGKIPWTSRKRTGSSGFGLPNSSFHMGASAMEQRLSRLTSLLITRLKEWLLNSYNVGLTSNDRRYISHDGSMVLLYMVCHGSHQYTPFMLAYIAAPWILWVYIYIIYIYIPWMYLHVWCVFLEKSLHFQISISAFLLWEWGAVTIRTWAKVEAFQNWVYPLHHPLFFFGFSNINNL